MENEEAKEIIEEEIVEIVEVVENKNPESPEPISAEKKDEDAKPEKNSRALIAITIILVIILVGLVGFIVVKKYPKITSLVSNNKYGFDYNINNVKSYDWDTLLTDKKVAHTLGAAEKNISSYVKPDYAWLLTDPEEFVKAECGSIISQQILDQENKDGANLLNVNMMICINNAKTTDLFNSRKDEINQIASAGSGISIKNMKDIKGFGTDAYNYLVEKKTPASSNQPETTTNYSGLIFKRGPFLVQIEEADDPANGVVVSDGKARDKVAQMIDMGLKRSLSAF